MQGKKLEDWSEQVLENHFISGGDSNTQHTWCSDKETTKGRELLKAAQLRTLNSNRLVIQHMTTKNGRSSSLIYFFVLRRFSFTYTSIEENSDWTSDNSPNYLDIKRSCRPPHFTIRLTDCDGFRTELDQKLQITPKTLVQKY